MVQKARTKGIPLRHQVDALKLAADHVDQVVLLVDGHGAVFYGNAAFERFTGFANQDVHGRLLADFLMDHGGDGDPEAVRRILQSKGTSRATLSLRRKDGDGVDAAFRVLRSGNGSGKTLHVLVGTAPGGGEPAAIDRDPGDADRYALAAQCANDGLWDWDLKNDRVHTSARWKAMLGCGEDEIGESLDEWLKWIHPEDVEEFKVKIYAHLEGLTPHFEHEHRMLHKTGRHLWMLTRGLAVRDGDGKSYRMAGSLTDITGRKNAEEQIMHDAFHDALTGLPNRALFIDRLGQSLARAERKTGYHFAVLFLDLDRFKVVNESLSHTIGDRLLVELAERVNACLRPADSAARLGGDEFAILLEEIQDAHDAVGFAERLNKALKEPFRLQGNDVFTSASIGIALGSPAYERPEDILRDADTAMYRAKALGRARHAVFDSSMHTRAVALLQLETDLRRALEHGDFRVYYQPIVSLKTGKTAGFEALIRWIHPKRGIVMPAEFIPLAEETGLIIPMGRWVLQEACRQLRAWQTRHSRTVPLMISVNLSALQFLRPELIAQVDLLLRETGLEGSDLKLEITESVIMEHAEYAMDMLKQIKAQNIRLCIDDFGTGYSSMSYLRQYPIDTVKIDKSFTTRIDTDPESLEIVKTVVTMAHNLGKDIIAEGVETREQLATIKALKCEYAQGFFFSKAVDNQAAESLIAWRWYW